MELKGRLKLIADMVVHCNRVCDIGTDHAYIPIYLIKEGKCKKAIAADVRKGPILIADRNIRRYNLEGQIITRLGNGLQAIEGKECDTIIIAGMGGMLIRDILQYGIEKVKPVSSVLLQPMNAIEVVREWLYKNGFEITEEKLASEGEKIYNVINARWSGISEEIEEIYYYIGKKLIERKDPLLKDLLSKKIVELQKIIDGMKKAKKSNAELDKYLRLSQQMKALRIN